MRRGLIAIAAVVSALMLSVVLVSTLIDTFFVYHWISLSRVLVLLISAATIFGLLQLIKSKKLAKLLSKKEPFYVVGFFIVLVLVQLFIYRFIAIYQEGWDIETVFRASGLSGEGRLTEGLRYYLTQFPNNFGVTMLMGSWFKLTSWLPVGWTIRALALNILFVDISILLVYLSVRALRGTASAIKSSWLALLFSPFFLYLPVFYTDTLSMPFAIGLICAYIYLKCSESRAQKYLLAAVMGLLAVFAFALKPTALIVLIAIIIYEILAFRSAKNTAFNWSELRHMLKVPAIFIAVVIPCATFFITARNMVSIEGVEALPWQNYVMMGATGNGGFERSDRDAALEALDENGATAAEVAEQSWETYIARVRKFGPFGYANFLLNKLSYTWGDGTFYAPIKLERSPVSAEVGSGSKTWLQQIVLPEGKLFTPFLYIQNGFWVAALIVFVIGSWRDIKAFGSKEKQSSFSVGSVKFILRLAILGLALFFLFWETRSRYIVNYTPIFVLLLTLELPDLLVFIQSKLGSKRLIKKGGK